MNVNEVKIGKSVYYQEPWSRCIEIAKIIEIIDDTVVKLKCETYGTRNYPIDKLYTSVDELKKAIKEKFANDVQALKNSIKTIEDLLIFPLLHCLCGEEYTEYEAIHAYKAKAKELLNIDL